MTETEDQAGKFDELVAATIRTAVDNWKIQNDSVDLHGVDMSEYIRRALADAVLLATVRLEQLTAEVERLKDVDAEAFATRFQLQSCDIVLGRIARVLTRLLTDAGASRIPKQLPHLAYRAEEEFQAVVRQRDEALAALEKHQALLAAASPVQHRVWVNHNGDNETADRPESWAWTATCTLASCRQSVSGTERDIQDWKDQHEAETLRPVLSRRFDNPSARVSAVEGAPLPPSRLVCWEPVGPAPRLRACVEAWPECETGAYNPSCCRFPKSCSATIYDETAVKPEDLEAEADASPAPRIWAPGSPAPDESVTEVIAENDVTFKRTSRGEWHATPPEGNGSVFSWAQINQFLTLTEVLEAGRG